MIYVSNLWARDTRKAKLSRAVKAKGRGFTNRGSGTGSRTRCMFGWQAEPWLMLMCVRRKEQHCSAPAGPRVLHWALVTIHAAIEIRHFELVVKTCEDHWDDIRQLLTEEQKSGGLNFWFGLAWPIGLLLDAAGSQVSGPRPETRSPGREGWSYAGGRCSDFEWGQTSPALSKHGALGFMILLNYYDAAKLRLKAPRKEKNIKKNEMQKMRASIASFIPWFQDVLYPELLHKRLLALYGDLGSLVPSATFFFRCLHATVLSSAW